MLYFLIAVSAAYRRKRDLAAKKTDISPYRRDSTARTLRKRKAA
jgi:hypothetical protein